MHSKSTKPFSMNRLPPELISEVFLHCADWYTRVSGYGRKGPVTSHPPVLFGRVCSGWRQISLSTPGLWGRLVLSEEISTQAFDRNFAALGVFLERSGSYPLVLKFPVDHQRRHWLGDNWEASLNRLIPLIIPHSRRWRAISGVFTQSCAKMIFSRFPNVPLLETLEIMVRNHYKREVITIDLSEALPLSTLYIPHSTTQFRFSGHIQQNLRELCACGGSSLYLTLNDCFQCLAHCPFIEQFAVTTVEYLHSSLSPAIIELPNLESLVISCEQGGDISSLFNALRLLAMRNFTFSSTSASTPLDCPWSAIRNMLARSPKLRLLDIHAAPVVVEDLAKCLAMTPHLRFIDLQNIPHGNSIISLLTFPRPSDENVLGLCPKLGIIILDFTFHTDQISMPAVAEMILSRCPSDTDGPSGEGSTIGGQTSDHFHNRKTLRDVRLGSISEFTKDSLTAQFPELVATQVETMILNESHTRLVNRHHEEFQ